MSLHETNKLKPLNGQVIVELAEQPSSTIVVSGKEEQTQKGKVLDFAKYYIIGGSQFGVENFSLKIGDIVYFNKHATADTPKELEKDNKAFVHYTQLLAVEEQDE